MFNSLSTKNHILVWNRFHWQPLFCTICGWWCHWLCFRERGLSKALCWIPHVWWRYLQGILSFPSHRCVFTDQPWQVALQNNGQALQQVPAFKEGIWRYVEWISDNSLFWFFKKKIFALCLKDSSYCHYWHLLTRHIVVVCLLTHSHRFSSRFSATKQHF